MILGTRLKLIKAPLMPTHKFLNMDREVVKVQTNGIYLSNPLDNSKRSQLDFPKKDYVVIRKNGFTILEDELNKTNLKHTGNKIPVLNYELI